MQNRILLNNDGSLDEVVTDGGCHLEHMGGKSWFIDCVRADGSSFDLVQGKDRVDAGALSACFSSHVMTSDDRTVRHYLQRAHDRGGGWEMAMRMMAGELAYAYEGRRGPDAEPDARFGDETFRVDKVSCY